MGDIAMLVNRVTRPRSIADEAEKSLVIPASHGQISHGNNQCSFLRRFKPLLQLTPFLKEPPYLKTVKVGIPIPVTLSEHTVGCLVSRR
jgi:hypothetical protein